MISSTLRDLSNSAQAMNPTRRLHRRKIPSRARLLLSPAEHDSGVITFPWPPGSADTGLYPKLRHALLAAVNKVLDDFYRV